MGTTFIKLGQFLATRPDIIGEQLAKDLEKLQDKVPAFDIFDAKKISKKEKVKVSFGFYSSLLVFIFFVITLSRILYFSQEFIIITIPASEYYLNYFFESIRNIFEIWKNLISSY